MIVGRAILPILHLLMLHAINATHVHNIPLLRDLRQSRPVADSGGTAEAGAEGSCRLCAAVVHTAVAERCIAAEERHTAAAVRPLPAAIHCTLRSTAATAASTGSDPLYSSPRTFPGLCPSADSQYQVEAAAAPPTPVAVAVRAADHLPVGYAREVHSRRCL